MAQESRLVIVIDSKNAERNARAIATELESIERNGDFASKSMDRMSVATRHLAGYMAGLVTVGAAIGKIDAYTGLQNRLKLVTSSQQQLNQAMGDTFSIAQKTYSSWDSVVQVYQRFSDNAKTLNINMEQTAKLTETVSKAVAVSGASAQAADAALMQFGQALASGVLRGEELNSIMEQTPALAKAIAQGMGITVGELRAVAAEGQITGDVLVEALTKASDSVDELFSKTDITIGQSLSLLNNEVQRFVGEASQGSGAATVLADSIKLLAQNLSLITDVATIGGVAMLTKAIIDQTVAVHGSITAAIQRRAANTAALQTQVQLAAVEVQRTRQVAALTLTEINLARQELNSATTRQARAAATMRLTQAEIAHRIALQQTTAAIAAQTTAQTGLNTATTIGSRALALVGGWTGVLTIGVTALAAGYMYFSNKAAEANAKLEEQGRIANKTNEELKKLAGNDKVLAVNDLTAAFDDQNKKLAESKEAVDAVLFAIRASSVENERARKITEDAKNGVISYTDAIKLLNNEEISVDLYNKLKQQADQYDENSSKAANTQRALAALKVEVDLAGNAMQNAAGQARDKANAMNQDEIATRGAAAANREYTASLQQKLFDQAFITRLVVKHNKTQQEANLLLEAHKKTNGQISAQDKELIAGITAQQKALENYNKVRSSVAKSPKASSSGRSAAAAERKQARDAERLAEEIGHIQEDVAYRYADREKQIELNLQKELAEMRKGGVDKNYQDRAIHRADIEKQVYRAQLEYELNEFKWTERQKLEQKHKIDQLSLNLNEQFSAKELTYRSKALYQQHQHELGLLELAKEQRIFQAQQALYSEMELIKRRYELERQEIARTVNDPNERAELLNGSFASQSKDESGVRDRTISDYRGVMGLEESPLVKQFEVLDKMRELDLISEEKYQQDKLMLQTKYSASYMQSMLGGFMSLVDENSSAYAAMFAAQKAFAVAQALMNIPATYSNTVNAVSAIPLIGPYIAPAMGAAAAALQVAQAASIKSTNMTGFKSGGYTGNYGTNQVAGVVHGQEYVLNAEATKRVGVNTLNAINNGSTIQAEKQAQANAKASGGKPQTIDNNLRVIMVKDENEAKDWLYGPEGEKAFLYHMKRNRSKF